MKLKTLLLTIAAFLATSIPFNANAQYSQIASGIQSALTPALSGSGSYQGFVEAGYSRGLKPYPADFIELNTTQGYRYKSWFFMGAGLGVDMLRAHKNNTWGSGWQPNPGPPGKNGITSNAVMLPVFTDFRFIIGDAPQGNHASFFIDLKVGCSFLLSDKYVAVGNGLLTNSSYFFLRPSLGVRIPVSQTHPKRAVNVGLSYKLLTSNYWIGYNNNVTLQTLGGYLAFEW